MITSNPYSVNIIWNLYALWTMINSFPTWRTSILSISLIFPICDLLHFISYLGMKSWDLLVCERASTTTHLDRVKKSNPWYKIWLWLNVTELNKIVFLLFSFILLQFQNIWGKIALLHTFFKNQSLLQLIFGRLLKHASALAIQSNNDNSKTFEWQDKCFHMAGGDLICQFCIRASHFQ